VAPFRAHDGAFKRLDNKMTDTTYRLQTLTEGQRRDWDEKGYFVVRGALQGETLQQVLVAAEEVEARKRRERGLGPDDTLEVRNAIIEHEEFWKLLAYEATFSLVLDLMDGDIQLSTSHLIVRPPVPASTPKSYKALGWHGDAPQAIADDGRLIALKVGYFLSDVSQPWSGALLVSPGSHKRLHLEKGPDGDVPADRVAEVNALPGDAVIFGHRTYHAVGPNYSGRPRKVLYFGYNRRWLRPIDYVSMPPEMLSKFDPIGRQLLGDAVTQCGYYLPAPDDEPLKAWLAKRQSEASVG
jgi:ectoine hydroxylase